MTWTPRASATSPSSRTSTTASRRSPTACSSARARSSSARCGAVPRRHGPRARARHHDQGARRAARLPRAGRPGLRPEPDRHARPRRLHLRGVAQPGRLRGRHPGRRRRRRASRRRRWRTSTSRSTTISRSCPVINKIDLPSAEPGARDARDRGGDRSRRLRRDPRRAPRRASASTSRWRRSSRDIPPPAGDAAAPTARADLRLLVRPLPRRRGPRARDGRDASRKGERIRLMATGKEFEVTRARRARAAPGRGGASSDPGEVGHPHRPASRTSPTRASATR